MSGAECGGWSRCQGGLIIGLFVGGVLMFRPSNDNDRFLGGPGVLFNFFIYTQESVRAAMPSVPAPARDVRRTLHAP